LAYRLEQLNRADRRVDLRSIRPLQQERIAHSKPFIADEIQLWQENDPTSLNCEYLGNPEK
jgi:hypothetical protein